MSWTGSQISQRQRVSQFSKQEKFQVCIKKSIVHNLYFIVSVKWSSIYTTVKKGQLSWSESHTKFYRTKTNIWINIYLLVYFDHSIKLMGLVDRTLVSIHIYLFKNIEMTSIKWNGILKQLPTLSEVHFMYFFLLWWGNHTIIPLHCNILVRPQPLMNFSLTQLFLS